MAVVWNLQYSCWRGLTHSTTRCFDDECLGHLWVNRCPPQGLYIKRTPIRQVTPTLDCAVAESPPYIILSSKPFSLAPETSFLETLALGFSRPGLTPCESEIQEVRFLTTFIGMFTMGRIQFLHDGNKPCATNSHDSAPPRKKRKSGSDVVLARVSLALSSRTFTIRILAVVGEVTKPLEHYKC